MQVRVRAFHDQTIRSLSVCAVGLSSRPYSFPRFIAPALATAPVIGHVRTLGLYSLTH